MAIEKERKQKLKGRDLPCGPGVQHALDLFTSASFSLQKSQKKEDEREGGRGIWVSCLSTFDRTGREGGGAPLQSIITCCLKNYPHLDTLIRTYDPVAFLL
ncbi:hypothetical protein H6P81_013333 [Aristolochia fimbriata]|uniref:Uncharacterized protein n=1 Tax=Aristolochia fimbriata TaxID=158543 RepID=A0AAV7EGL4_ARIFI|nr:hypothetical protein H6P81_013333 [Aristolochia fimbriata]